MPPIDQAEFLQRVFDLLTDAGPGNALAPPMDHPQPRSFADVFGPEGRLLPHLAAQARDSGDPGMAGLMLALDQALQDGSLVVQAGPKPAPRLTGYIYPVV